MTEKKELILQTALRLFSQRGYEGTPTSLIAREAGVSEGLIFRHFINKEGLLLALLDLGHERLRPFTDELATLTDPRDVLNALIELPRRILGVEREFWRLQFSLKGIRKTQTGQDRLPRQTDPFFQAAFRAFAQLGYAQPELETRLLYLIVEGLGNALLLNDDVPDYEMLIAHLKGKYGLS